MSDGATHEILQLWLREASGPPPEGRERLSLEKDQGVVGDHTFGEKRHVTLLFEDDWQAAVKELGTPVDPSARRANLLLSGGGAAAWIGKQMRIGPCLLEIHGETKPCSLMDKAQMGLKAALQSECRAGVWGRILEGGELQAGDRAGSA